MFKAGKRQGEGIMRYATGQTAAGIWTEGALTEEKPVPPEGTAAGAEPPPADATAPAAEGTAAPAGN